MAIMTDHADRTWCTKPGTKQWHDAWLKAFRAANPFLNPKVGISSAHPRQPVKFARVMK